MSQQSQKPGLIEQSSQADWTSKKVDKFIVLNNLLGSGSFGKVYKGFYIKDERKQVACKSIDIQHLSSAEKIMDLIKREIQILKKLSKNKYITRLLDVSRTQNNLYIFLEFCGDGDLDKYIKEKGVLSESEAILFFRHICEGFKELQKNDIIHRDIKPANILLHKGRAKISDFGFSRVIETGCDIPGYFSRLGSPLYMSPQILEDCPFSSKCDVWSVGIVLYEMLYGQTPWTGKNQSDLRSNIKKQPLKFPEQYKRTDEIKSLIEKMLKYEEKDRISWGDVFKSELLKKSMAVSVSTENSNTLSLGEDYIGQNLVHGYLDQDVCKESNNNNNNNNKNGNSNNANSGADSGTDSKNGSDKLKNGVQSNTVDKNMQLSKIMENQKKDEQIRKAILKVDSYILYERNIAFFFNYAIQKLMQSYDKKILALEKSTYYRALYILGKNQCITIKNILNMMNAQSDQQKLISPEFWEYYKKSDEYEKTQRLLMTDLEHNSKFFAVCKEQTLNLLKKETSKILKKYQDKNEEIPEDIKKYLSKVDNFIKIIDDNFTQNDTFKTIYRDTLKSIITFLKPMIKMGCKKELAIIGKYMQVCKNPYTEFINAKYDFNMFYEKIERSNENELIEMFQIGMLKRGKNDMSVQQSNQTSMQSKTLQSKLV